MTAIEKLIEYILRNPEWTDTDAPIYQLALAAAHELYDKKGKP